MELKMPTQEQVLEAYHYIDNEELEFFLKKLWPQAFEDEKSVELDIDTAIRLPGKGPLLVWVHSKGKEIVFNSNYDWEFTRENDCTKAIPTRRLNEEKLSSTERIKKEIKEDFKRKE